MSLADIVERIKRGPVGTAPPPPKPEERVPAPRTRPAPRSRKGGQISGQPSTVIQETVPESKKRVIPFLDPSLHGAGVTVIQLGAGDKESEMKTLPPGFDTPPSAYPGTTSTEISMSPERISQIQTELHKKMPEKRYFIGVDPATGERMHITESPYQKTFGYTPRDPDYSIIEWGLASDKETTTDFLTQMSEMFPMATENITTIQQQLKMVEGTPEGTMFKIGEEDVFDTSKTEAKEYLIEALVANQEVIKSSQYIPGMKQQLESIEETEFTVGMFKKLGYEVDIADDVYSFKLPKASIVHETIYGDVSDIQLGMAGLMHTPFGIGTLADITTSLVTGDPTAKQRRYEETAEYSLGLSKAIKEGGYLPHVLISPAMVSGVYIPAVTIGAGYAITGVISGASQIGIKTSSLISKFTPHGQEIIRKAMEAGSIASQPLIATGRAAGHVMGTRVGEALMTGGLYAVVEGPHIAELAVSDPSRIPSRIAESAFGWGMAIGGFKLGAKAYATDFPRQEILGGTKGSPRSIFEKYGSYERNIPSYRGYPGMFDSKGPSFFERVKSSVFEPSSFEYRQLYGLTGMDRSDVLIRGRVPYGASTDVISREQVYGGIPEARYRDYHSMIEASQRIPSKYDVFFSPKKANLLKLDMLKNLKIETQTKILVNPKNPAEAFFVSKHAYKDVISIGKLDIGAKGSKVIGKTFYKLSPENVFYQTQPFKSYISTKHIGEMKGYIVSESTGLSVPYDEITTQLYGHTFIDAKTGMFEPSFIKSTSTKGFSVQKSISAGDTYIKGGFIEQYKHDVSLMYSKGFFRSRLFGGTYKDTAVSLKPKLKGAGGHYDDPGGFDYVIPKMMLDDIVMPGGIPISETMKIDLISPFDSLKTRSASKLIDMDLDDYVSSYWSKVFPVGAKPKITSHALSRISVLAGVSMQRSVADMSLSSFITKDFLTSPMVDLSKITTVSQRKENILKSGIFTGSVLATGTISSSLLGSATISEQKQASVQQQMQAQALSLSLLHHVSTSPTLETTFDTGGGSGYVFDPFISIPPPSFVFDIGTPSFEGFDEFKERPVKGRKYRRKTHPVELIEGIL